MKFVDIRDWEIGPIPHGLILLAHFIAEQTDTRGLMQIGQGNSVYKPAEWEIYWHDKEGRAPLAKISCDLDSSLITIHHFAAAFKREFELAHPDAMEKIYTYLLEMPLLRRGS